MACGSPSSANKWGVIAILPDLKLDAIPRIVAASSAPLPLRPLRSVVQDIGNDLKTANVTKAAKH